MVPIRFEMEEETMGMGVVGEAGVVIFRIRLIDHRHRRLQETSIARIHSQRFWIRSLCLRPLGWPTEECLHLLFPSSMHVDRPVRVRTLMDMGMERGRTDPVVESEDNMAARVLMARPITTSAEGEGTDSMKARSNTMGLVMEVADQSATVITPADRAMVKEDTVVAQEAREEGLRIIAATTIRDMAMGMGGVERAKE